MSATCRFIEQTGTSTKVSSHEKEEQEEEEEDEEDEQEEEDEESGEKHTLNYLITPLEHIPHLRCLMGSFKTSLKLLWVIITLLIYFFLPFPPMW